MSSMNREKYNHFQKKMFEHKCTNCKVRDHGDFAGKYKVTAHSILKLKISYT